MLSRAGASSRTSELKALCGVNRARPSSRLSQPLIKRTSSGVILGAWYQRCEGEWATVIDFADTIRENLIGRNQVFVGNTGRIGRASGDLSTGPRIGRQKLTWMIRARGSDPRHRVLAEDIFRPLGAAFGGVVNV